MVEFKGLTDVQQEILDMLQREYLTVKQIAEQRHTSLKAVYKVVNILRRKGVISKGYTRGLKNIVSIEKKVQKKVQNKKGTISGSWRLHAQQFDIMILRKSVGYDVLRSKRNVMIVDGNTVKLHDEVVEVYCNELRFFWGTSPGDAEEESFRYWLGFFHVLEQRVGCILVKDGVSSVNQSKAHLAHVDDDVARDYVKRRQPLKVYAHEDGKLAITVDQSHGRVELEFLHPKKYKRDADSVGEFLEGLRGVDGFTPQFVLSSLGQLTASLHEVVELLRNK